MKPIFTLPLLVILTGCLEQTKPIKTIKQEERVAHYINLQEYDQLTLTPLVKAHYLKALQIK